VKSNNDYFVITLVALAHGTSHFFQLVVAPLFPLIKQDLGVSYAALGFALAPGRCCWAASRCRRSASG